MSWVKPRKGTTMKTIGINRRKPQTPEAGAIYMLDQGRGLVYEIAVTADDPPSSKPSTT